ncbi:MAG: T9SS type A sorting domain-containing protein [Bacteroidia bacterium]
MKKILLICSTLISLSFFAHLQAQPGIAGGYIDYFCAGQDSFYITLHVTADCNSSLAFSKTLTATPECSAVSPVSIQLSVQDSADRTEYCEGACNRCSDPGCSAPYGFTEYRLTGILDLSQQACDKWTFNWQESKRSGAITTGPANDGIYLYATIDKAVAPCNSTSTLRPFGSTLICAGQCFMSYGNGPDPDGDSLVYSLVSAKSSPTQDVTYHSPYTAETPLYYNGFPNTTFPYDPPLCRGFHLDAADGTLAFRPQQAQSAIISYRIEEYRNQIKIGERVRDLMVTVINCPSNDLPILSGINGSTNFSTEACPGQNISFTINSSHPSTDTVFMRWDGGIPGANFTVSTGRLPTGTFSWTPKESDVRHSPYFFTLQATDNACPLPGNIIRSYRITVKPLPTAHYTVTDLGMGLYEFSITGSNPPGALVEWSGGDGIGTGNGGADAGKRKFTHQFSQEDTIPFRLRLITDCVNIYDDTLIVEFTTGMNKPLSANPAVQLFPNPAKGHATLLFDKSGFAPTTVELYSPEGKIVGTWRQEQPGELRMDREGLANGIYLLRLRNNLGQSWQAKLIFE